MLCVITPDLFAAGTPIATASFSDREIDNFQAPNVGVADHTLDLEQLTASPFTVDGQPVQFGQVGQDWRLALRGEFTRIDPLTPLVGTVLHGSAVITP